MVYRVRRMLLWGGGIKDAANTYGVLVRAGALTPQKSDEPYMRTALGLPEASDEVNSCWDSVGGVRRPITLALDEVPDPEGVENESTATPAGTQ